MLLRLPSHQDLCLLVLKVCSKGFQILHGKLKRDLVTYNFNNLWLRTFYNMSFVSLSDENVNQFCKIAKSEKFHFICLVISITYRNKFYTLHIVKYFMSDIVTSQKALQCFDLPVSLQLILEGFLRQAQQFQTVCR